MFPRFSRVRVPPIAPPFSELGGPPGLPPEWPRSVQVHPNGTRGRLGRAVRRRRYPRPLLTPRRYPSDAMRQLIVKGQARVLVHARRSQPKSGDVFRLIGLYLCVCATGCAGRTPLSVSSRDRTACSPLQEHALISCDGSESREDARGSDFDTEEVFWVTRAHGRSSERSLVFHGLVLCDVR